MLSALGEIPTQGPFLSSEEKDLVGLVLDPAQFAKGVDDDSDGRLFSS